MNTIKIDIHLLIYLFIILILFNNLKCEEGSETCCLSEENPSDCTEESCLVCDGNYKYFYSENKCVECPESSGPYITLEPGTDGEGNSISVCTFKTQKEEGKKLIENKNEIVSSCPSPYNYQLGDICYSEPFNTDKYEQIDSSNEYKCKFFFYENKINGFTYKDCLGEEVKCSNLHYYDPENKQCFSSSCPDDNAFLKKEDNGNGYIYRCSSECKNTPESEREYKYEETNDSDEVIKTYCVDECKGDKPYFTAPEEPEVNYKCVAQCGELKLPNTDNECISKDICKTFLVKDISNNIIICLSEEISECTDPYLYSYDVNENKRFCLKTCKDTSHINFSEGIAYLLESIKECKKPDDGTVSDKKIDLTTFKFVDDCKNLPSGPYFYQQKCKDNCEGKKLIYDTLECVDSCECQSCNYYELDDVCYTTCPRNSEKKYGKNGKCQKCITPIDPEHPIDDNEEGFITNGIQICYSSCGEIDPTHTKTFYYNNGENICYESSNGCKSNTIYKYSKYNDQNKKCYKSCSDIGDDSYKYEYQ